MSNLADLIGQAVEALPKQYRDRVIVCGGAAMVLAGLRETTDDLDLLASEETFDTLAREGFTAETEKPGVERIRLSAEVSLYKTWPGIRFWDVYPTATVSANSQGLKIASLQHVLVSKVASSRPKDEADIQILRRALNSSGAPFWSSQQLRETIDLWFKYETVAMHFNDLLLKLRTQALGGLAAVAALTTLFNDKIPLDIRTTALRLVFIILAVVWVAIAALDQLYYQRLLTGAVDALRDFERSTGEAINLSLSIERKFLDKGTGFLRFRMGPVSFYLLILGTLLFAVLIVPRMLENGPVNGTLSKDHVSVQDAGPSP
jgi:hypothetical protein